MSTKNKSKTLKCFLCDGPHKVKEYLQKATLTALQAQVQEEEQAGSKRHDEVSKGKKRSSDREGSSWS